MNIAPGLLHSGSVSKARYCGPLVQRMARPAASKDSREIKPAGIGEQCEVSPAASRLATAQKRTSPVVPSDRRGLDFHLAGGGYSLLGNW
jgi:hypothetical protein